MRNAGVETGIGNCYKKYYQLQLCRGYQFGGWKQGTLKQCLVEEGNAKTSLMFIMIKKKH